MELTQEAMWCLSVANLVALRCTFSIVWMSLAVFRFLKCCGFSLSALFCCTFEISNTSVEYKQIFRTYNLK